MKKVILVILICFTAIISYATGNIKIADYGVLKDASGLFTLSNNIVTVLNENDSKADIRISDHAFLKGTGGLFTEDTQVNTIINTNPAFE
ncbi:MAG: hypothetical protein LBH05_04940 [Deferribacteraceae bacterium]|jgi:hypothetical protein|nr:hypothetical protein [Deferribacteraceae bacterium]